MMLTDLISIMQEATSRLVLPLLGYFLIMSIIYIYKLFSTKDTLKAWYKKRLINACFSIIATIIFWGLTGFMSSVIGVGVGGSAPTPSIPISDDNNTSPYADITSTIKDTREFIKTSFSATLKARDVEDTSTKIKILIKGNGGRIDSSNISEKYAYFSFVIPKSNLDDFETQLKTYTNKKLYSQREYSQNLLNEKQNLERNQDLTKKSISSLNSQQNEIKNNYEKDSKLVKAEINSKNAQLTIVRNSILQNNNQLSNATDTIVRSNISNQLSILGQNENNLLQSIQTSRANLTNLTNSFKLSMSNLGLSLDQQNNVLSNLDTQEGNFFDKIETVNGDITIKYASVWELLDTYSPINPIIILLTFIFILRIYFLSKKEKELITL